MGRRKLPSWGRWYRDSKRRLHSLRSMSDKSIQHLLKEPNEEKVFSDYCDAHTGCPAGPN